MLIAHVCLACATSDEACHVQPSRREPGGVCHVWSKLGVCRESDLCSSQRGFTSWSL